jgi:hypothetical protein
LIEALLLLGLWEDLDREGESRLGYIPEGGLETILGLDDTPSVLEASAGKKARKRKLDDAGPGAEQSPPKKPKRRSMRIASPRTVPSSVQKPHSAIGRVWKRKTRNESVEGSLLPCPSLTLHGTLKGWEGKEQTLLSMSRRSKKSDVLPYLAAPTLENDMGWLFVQARTRGSNLYRVLGARIIYCLRRVNSNGTYI